MLPFDRVVIVEGDNRTTMAVGVFLAMPLARRVKYVLARAVEFYDGPVLVERRIALASLRDAQT